MKRSALIVLGLLVSLVNFSFGQEPTIVTSDKPGWHKIGEVKASFKMETESIAVFGKDEFKSIKLKVTDAPINIEKVTVFYESGDVQDISVTGSLNAGTETEIYKLNNPSVELQKVVFTYKSMLNAKEENAHIELYGLK